MKSKQVLSVEQMKHLQELGLDTSDGSMCWCYALSYKNAKWELEIYEDVINQKRDSAFWEIIPTYTLQDILDKLPPIIDEVYWLTLEVMDRRKNEWKIKYARINAEHELQVLVQKNLLTQPTRCCAGVLKTDMLKRRVNNESENKRDWRDCRG
jgi:hypothetical protein